MASNVAETEPSEAEAYAALQELGKQAVANMANEPVKVESKTEVAEQVADATPAADAPVETQAETVIGQQDDVESLKARLKEREEYLESVLTRSSSSLEWSRNLALRTATERDNLKKVLKTIREKGEVSAEEIDRLLGAQTATEVPQTYGNQPQPTEDLSAADAFRWQLDNRKTDEYCQKFDAWIRENAGAGRLGQHEIIPGNAYATLQVLNARYERESHESAAPSPSVVKAAQAVARTQRAAARAAGPPGNRSSASSPPDTQVDLDKLIRENPEEALKSGLIDKLFKQVHAEAGLG